MRPYHVKSKHFSRWIDLDVIQMIGDVVEHSIETMPVDVTTFTITLAFQDKPIYVKSFKVLAGAVPVGLDHSTTMRLSAMCGTPSTLAEVLDERKAIHALHDALVAAWAGDSQ